MKIIQILQNYHPSRGGTQFLFKNVSEKIVNLFGDEVTIITTNAKYDPSISPLKQKKIQKKIEIINNIKIYRFSYWTIFYWINKILNYFKINNEILKIIKSGPVSLKMFSKIIFSNADVICASSFSYIYMLYPKVRFILPKPKAFVFMGAIHFDDKKGTNIPNRYILDSIKKSDAYIANTDYEKKCLVNLGVSESKITVIGCGVNLFEFKNLNKTLFKKKYKIPKSDFVIGYVGRFAHSKKIEVLIDAFDSLEIENKFLVIAGASNSYLNHIQNYISSKPKMNFKNIKFILDFEDNQKNEIYGLLDVFVNPSCSESFGIVFLEAWASKVPVIGCDIGAIKSVIINNFDGFLVIPEDKDSLSMAIMKYYLNYNLRIDHATNGFEKIQKLYTWDIVATKYRHVYVNAINQFNAKN